MRKNLLAGLVAGVLALVALVAVATVSQASGPGAPLAISTGGHANCLGVAGTNTSGDGTVCVTDGAGNYTIATGTAGPGLVVITLSAPFVGWDNVARPDAAHAVIHVVRPDNRLTYKGPLQFDWLAAK